MTFGEDLFRNGKLSFEPNINIPTPKEYRLTAGDEVIITIWGDSELLYKEAISPDGVVNIPNYGPINLSGVRVEDAQKMLYRRLSKVYKSLGTTSQLMLSVGQIGSIRVNISGEVVNPGTYTIPSIANMLHLLHLASGTTDIGDMRNIELYRGSKCVATLDLYDYILGGNCEGNTLLQDGDIVVVHPYQIRVAARGEVRRPMYYQLKRGESAADLVAFAGGFNDRAYCEEVKLYRNNGTNREILVIGGDSLSSTPLIDGDRLLIDPANNEYRNIVSIRGALWREGDFQFDDDTATLKALIDRAGGLQGDAFASRGVITRRNEDYTTSMINFTTADVASGKSDITLRNHDKVYIPSIEDLRENQYITVAGEVNAPATIPYHEGMRIEDAIVLTGGLKRSASLARIDVTRRIDNSHSTQYSDTIAESFDFSINEDLTLNETTRRFTLRPFDVVVIRRSPQYTEQPKIYIMGEVLFPGRYTLTQENTYLSDVIAIAHGTTPNAYLKGTSLTRRTHTASASRSVNNSDYYTAGSVSSMALENIRESTGRRDTLSVSSSDIRTFSVGIDMQSALRHPRGAEDILLQDDDIILIPKYKNIVNIVGAVYYPNATLFTSHRLKHYINASGGYNKVAIRRPFVIYPNGMVASTRRSCFRRRVNIEAGCVVVVPSKENRDGATLAQTISAVSGLASVASSISTLGVAISK